MLVAFCVGHFIAGCVSAYRIFAICDGCHHLIAEMRETKKSLNELTILKHKVIKSGFIYISTVYRLYSSEHCICQIQFCLCKVLSTAQLFELSVLNSKFDEHIGNRNDSGGISAKGWFTANRGMVTSAFSTMFIALVVATSSKMVP